MKCKCETEKCSCKNESVLRTTIRKIIKEELKDDMDNLQYDMIARKLVTTYQDNIYEQDLSSLVDKYVFNYKSKNGIAIDAEKLYDAMLKMMRHTTDSSFQDKKYGEKK